MQRELSFYLQLKLNQLFEDVSVGIKKKGLEALLAYELFDLESQIAEAKARGDETLAKTILAQPSLRQRVATAPSKKSAPPHHAKVR